MNDYEIKKLYEEMEMYLISSMKRNLGRHLNEEKKTGFKFTQWQAAQLKELKRYQRENKKIIGRYTLGLDKDVSDHLQNELKKGSINAIKQYNKITGKSLKPDRVMNKSFFKTNDKKVNALIKVVNNDLKTANTSALRMTNDAYRQVIHKSAFFVGNGVMTERQAIDEANKMFLNAGLNCIEYKDGRRVNIASYSQMAVRTASLRTQLMGEGDFRASIGRTLVKVTTHGGACPLCTGWQGMVLVDDVYSGGKADGKHKLLSDAMAQGFLHPNCRHGLTTYYPELEEEDDTEEVEETPQENNSSNMANTIKDTIKQESTQQSLNYAIRNVKRFRRLQNGSLDRSNVERYRIKKQEWTDEAKQLDNQLHNKSDIIETSREYLDDILTDDEKRYLNRYISSDSYKINNKLYEGIALDEEDKLFIKNLDNVLDKMPNYEGIVNRSMFIENQEHLNKILSIFDNEKGIGHWESYSSSSKDVYDETDNLRLIIKSKTGKNISMFNENEQEILFKRKVDFKLLNVYSKDKKIYVEIEEV